MKIETIREFKKNSLKNYMIGFGLSIILTVLSFAIVINVELPSAIILAIISILAVAQIIVQCIFFLHMNSTSNQNRTGVAWVYTGILLSFLVGGSLWIIYHLNKNMM